ncbi:MAG TPA: hypothetical protein PLS10_13985 [Chitinophagales bacterium]|nr:hypothetical protein [Chitinophagales bacterium]
MKAEEIFNEIPFLDKKGEYYNMPKSQILEAMEEYASQDKWVSVEERLKLLENKLQEAAWFIQDSIISLNECESTTLGKTQINIKIINMQRFLIKLQELSNPPKH